MVLNLQVGSRIEVDGRTCILTKKDVKGHAVYGPYQEFGPGKYVVEFGVRALTDQKFGDDVCAVLDVAAQSGQVILTRKEIRSSDLQENPSYVFIEFEVDEWRTLEFRVEVTGTRSLLIDEYRRSSTLLASNGAPGRDLLDASFPEGSSARMPEFFQRHFSYLRQLYERGVTIKIVDDEVVVTIDGVSFHARDPDDLRFVDEIFFRSAYNFFTHDDCVVIDIGMNIGLVALTFARKPFVKEVHSFEPFRKTFDRAISNLDLNPELSGKIRASNFGLSDVEQKKTILIHDESDSGAISIRGSASGNPTEIDVRDAAAVLRPIIQSAKQRGLRVIAKVDCEGSEFPIFEALEASGLLPEISAFMVEWHRGTEGKNQRNLIDPLSSHGFTVFDLSGRTGNGFFYAAK